MPKRASRPAPGSPRATLLLAATAITLFIGGEALILARTDKGQLWEARYLRVGDPARISLLIGRQIRRGLETARVPADSVRETVVEHGRAPLRWRVGLAPDASLLRVNYGITKALEQAGGEVLAGREHAGSGGETQVVLLIGLPNRPTHEVVLLRPAPGPETIETAPRLALVLFGFGEDPKLAEALIELPLRFTVAIPPAETWSPSLFQAAREHSREVVLHLPLEPLNYPQISPGPGTILVSMRPAKIAGLVSHYLDQAGPVAAVANHMGSLATRDMTVMGTVYRELRRRHLPFLHVDPAAGSVCKSLAGELGVAYDEPDLVLEGGPSKSGSKALEAGWKQALKQARQRGHVTVLLRATPQLERWLPQALSAQRLDGVNLVPLASLMKHPAAI